jgi:hypothetical protein
LHPPGWALGAAAVGATPAPRPRPAARRPAQLIDPRTGKVLRLSGSEASMEESIVTALDTQELIDKMQSHMAWATEAKSSGR